ncbi:MAG: DEAD/DEAH box helicase family protein [Myxococcales bacterium]|nr:DEAD/DEAH box helicase family protein [Myxococcales bacterium]
MNKKDLTETDIRTKFITPALDRDKRGKWDVMTQIREECPFTDGRVIVRGKSVARGERKRADYILYYKPNLPIAVIEAKDNRHSVGAGMQQALDYAEILDVPFAYSSNGDAFLEHDRTRKSGTIEREIPLHQFPSPDELWARYRASKGYSAAQQTVVTQDYYDDGSRKSPRYYQLVAINRTVDAIARGERRILLVMATGTGKTYTAFQIIWRLWKSGAKKRILFLVDRNILADQTKTNDFKPFGTALTKITNRTADKSFEIYLALYQAITGTEESQNIYKQFSPDFFDLVVVDECHRGSAAADASWRQVLDYFKSATQIGLTATPKETETVSNIEYFGDPIYTYSLKQGIEDGFLAPYKVVRVGLDKDLDGWRPERGKLDKYGREIEDREYTQRDYDRALVLDRRTAVIAQKISEYLKATDRFAKTIVFCEDIDHAERMRQALVNENADLVAQNRLYVMRITGDNDEGKAQLDNFIDPEKRYPVLVTTSRLMTTGVDAQTCQLIVLDRTIESQTEFKQIIGRGTRIREDYNKLFFTIMDFRQATAQFADPKFDGPPEQIYEPRADQSVVPPDSDPADAAAAGAAGLLTGASDDLYARIGALGRRAAAMGEARVKYHVDDVDVAVVTERVQYLDEHGKLITESLDDYTRRKVKASYASLAALLAAWQAAERKGALLEALAKSGVFIEELAAQYGAEHDPLDLIAHVAFAQPLVTRQQRVDHAAKRLEAAQAKLPAKARAVVAALIQKYIAVGISSLESMDILKVDPLPKLGTPMEIAALFGGKAGYLATLSQLKSELYS